jgi:SIR2-like domain
MIIPLNDALEPLATLLKQGKLIIFVGAGISCQEPSKLPTWHGFLESFINFCENLAARNPGNTDIANAFDNELIESARKEITKNPAHVATVLKSRIQDLPVTIQNQYKSWFISSFSNVDPNECHKLIARTNYPYVLTSNYDTLLEDAYVQSGLQHLAASFDESKIIAENIYERNHLIIHVHGDLFSDNVIFTSEDYTQIIKKEYPGFSFAIQSLFLTHSVLFVGYGGNDPHMEDLIEEFAYWYGNGNNNNSKNYLVTRKDNVNIITEQYKERVGTNTVTIDQYSDYGVLLEYLRKACPRHT